MASSSARPTVERNVRLPACENGESDTFALRLECDVYRPPEAIQRVVKNKDVFLLLHAHGKLGGSRCMLNAYAILLAMRGFVAYNVSFRGCDGNEKTSRASVFGEVDARDVLEMVKEIRTRESVDAEDGVEVKMHVFGYSFGAAVGANAVGLLHEKLLSQNTVDFCKGESEEERRVWSRCGIDGLILVAFPLGSLNPFAATSSLMGVVSRFLFGKHAGRLRKCFVKDKRNRGSLVARKTRLLFVHGQRDEFTRVKEVRKFCEKLAKGQPEEEDVNDDDETTKRTTTRKSVTRTSLTRNKTTISSPTSSSASRMTTIQTTTTVRRNRWNPPTKPSETRTEPRTHHHTSRYSKSKERKATTLVSSK